MTFQDDIHYLYQLASLASCHQKQFHSLLLFQTYSLLNFLKGERSQNSHLSRLLKFLGLCILLPWMLKLPHRKCIFHCRLQYSFGCCLTLRLKQGLRTSPHISNFLRKSTKLQWSSMLLIQHSLRLLELVQSGPKHL